MFSFGWSEIALTVLIIIIIVGPKEIPNLLRQIGLFTKSLKSASNQFKNSLNDLTEDSEIKDIKESIKDMSSIKDNLNPKKELQNEINSIKETISFADKEIKKINNNITNNGK